MNAQLTKNDTDTLCFLGTSEGEYRLIRQLAKGDKNSVTNVYLAEVLKGTHARTHPRVVIKVSRTILDNGLIINEQDLLERAKAHNIKALPKLLDRFSTEDGRIASALSFVDGLDLLGVRRLKRYQQGVRPFSHVGWFLERVLSTLAKLHSNMIVLGNLQPQHALVNHEHDVRLIDLCFSRGNPTAFDKIGIWTPHFSAPEIEHSAPPLPEMDIFSAGKCAVYFLGGDPETGELPKDLEPEMRLLIEKMIEPNYLKRNRSQDAFGLAQEVKALRKKLYGHPVWVDFPLN